MKWKNESKFQISGLNQEKLLNEISKSVTLFEVERKSKTNSSFKCSYFEHKKVLKILKNRGIKVESVTHDGLFCCIRKMLTCYGLIVAVVLFSIFYFVQNQFVIQFDVQGVDRLSSGEIVDFIKDNYSTVKSKIDTDEIELALVENFSEISLASCIIKGQTLVINIKEKLLPEEMYGDFAPLVAQKSGKITQINLISGTLCVKVGDFVQAGDVLVEPYTIDTSGTIKMVEAEAEIVADVYNEGSADHYETYIEVKRTGNVAVQNEITLFGLTIYSFKEDFDFQMYEVEYEEVNLVENLFLPFKIRKTYIYELTENVIVTDFEDVKDEYIEKARENALENVEDCDTIKEEYYTIRHIAGVTIVNYCIVTEESIATTYSG